MSEWPPCVLASSPQRILAGPLVLCLALAVTASGCSPSPASSQAGDATSKVPEIAKRQKRMEEMLKKTMRKPPGKPR